jgi:Zn finger protein HypA/HybF involved in hydrogenase expression
MATTTYEAERRLREYDELRAENERLKEQLQEKTARWEISSDGYYPYCSHCKQEPPGRELTPFCPLCGYAMGG